MYGTMRLCRTSTTLQYKAKAYLSELEEGLLEVGVDDARAREEVEREKNGLQHVAERGAQRVEEEKLARAEGDLGSVGNRNRREQGKGD